MSNIKLLTKNNIRIFVADMTDISNEAIKLLGLTPMPSLVLSTAIAVFGPLATIKRNTKTTAILNGDGLLGNIIVDSNDEGHVRGTVGNPSIITDMDEKNPNGIPLSLGVGKKGTLKIIQTSGDFTFEGNVDIVKGDIVTDLAYYFDSSEQTKSAVISSVMLRNKNELERSYGVVFQMLPGYTEEDVEWVENFTSINKISKMNLHSYIKLMKAEFLEEKQVLWKCNCSKEKFESIINTLNDEEKQKIIKEHGKLEVKCNFCNNKHQF